MIESIDNIIQLIITGICTLTAVYYGAKHLRREWTLLGLFSGVYFLGSLYWLLYLVLFSKSPQYSGIPYVSWYASYIFLVLLLIELRGKAKRLRFIRFWPVYIFTGGMCIYFMQFGAYVSNIVSAVLMSFLICYSIDGIIHQDDTINKKGSRTVCIFTLLFCVLEYAMWSASCIWVGDSIANPYFWFDFMLSVDFILIALSVRKAVKYELY